MNASPPNPLADPLTRPGVALDEQPEPAIRLTTRILLTLLLSVLVVAAGAPGLDFMWIRGDEFLFIVNNPEVTGIGNEATLGTRIATIFTHPHQDLYQPLPIATFAIEAAIWGPEWMSTVVRTTDLLLHTINALLVWNLLAALMRYWLGRATLSIALITWCLAALWALHPALVFTYAADMGRTHVLSAFFVLLSLRIHFAVLTPLSAERRNGWFALSLLLLILAQLCKVIPAWFLVIFAFEACIVGVPGAVRSLRVYLVTAVCAAFGVLAYLTSREYGILDDAEIAVFGDPLSRSLVAAWYYFRDIVSPGWVSAWQLPDIQTGWAYSRTWIGAALVGGSVILVVLGAARRHREFVLGPFWFWATLAPVLGLVAAREVAAIDRALYLPLVGFAIALAGVLCRWAVTASERNRVSAVLAGALVAGGAMFYWDRTLVQVARDDIGRAARVVALNPYDPRALEYRWIAEEGRATLLERTAREQLVFIQAQRDEGAPPEVLEELIEELEQIGEKANEYLRRYYETLEEAVDAAENGADYFTSDADRAAFHRRLSWQYYGQQAYERSLEQALRAADFAPDAADTWTRIARARHALRQIEPAIDAYRKALDLTPKDGPLRPVRLSDLANLLVDLGQPADAAPLFREALSFDGLPSGVKISATLGLAICEIRAGDGSRGRELAESVLKVNPQMTAALHVLAESHLRSHRWNEAGITFGKLLKVNPIDYVALRGLRNVYVQNGDWATPCNAWALALGFEPQWREARSFAVFDSACADLENGREALDRLLKLDENNPLACLGKMIYAIRDDNLTEALDWLDRAMQGRPVAGENPPARAEAELRQLLRFEKVPPTAALVRVKLLGTLAQTYNDPQLLAEARTLFESEDLQALLAGRPELRAPLEAALEPLASQPAEPQATQPAQKRSPAMPA